MVINIINAISVALNNEFKEYPVYSEQIKSNLQKPCFFINISSFSEEKMLSNRYSQRATFRITHFISESLRTNEELINVANCVKDIIEFIDFDNHKFNGKKISYNIEENMLIFYVTYSYFVYKTSVEDTEKMGDFDIIYDGDLCQTLKN